MPAKRRQATRMTPGFTGPFKGQPQPGTLFDKRALDQLPGNVEATRNRPGPRGYSPARLAEVRQAFDTARHDFKTGYDYPVQVGGLSGLNPLSHQYAPTASIKPGKSWGTEPVTSDRWGRARSRILDTLSRSTVPMKGDENSLSGLERITMGVSSDELGSYEHHTYKPNPHFERDDPKSPHLIPAGPQIKLNTSGFDADAVGPRAEQTLLHELGHHASWLDATEHYTYSTHKEQAQEEAYADRFAVKHFRPDPRDKTPYEPRENTYLARGLAGSHLERAADEYRRNFPAEMRPPAKKNRNLGKQFEQQTLANPFFFGTAQPY